MCLKFYTRCKPQESNAKGSEARLSVDGRSSGVAGLAATLANIVATTPELEESQDSVASQGSTGKRKSMSVFTWVWVGAGGCGCGGGGSVFKMTLTE